jgi:hypothetical protein|eukprot:COSAG01_NODE_1657_length_9590_cov_441.132336_3_plen_51_part_00
MRPMIWEEVSHSYTEGCRGGCGCGTNCLQSWGCLLGVALIHGLTRSDSTR